MPHTEDDVPESRKGFDFEELNWNLWYIPSLPISFLTRLDGVHKPSEQEWVLEGLLPSIAKEGRFLNPITVWNHGISKFAVQSGRNRVWCAKQLGWEHVPVLLSDERGVMYPEGKLIEDQDTLEGYFPHNGIRFWNSKVGWGVHVALRGPELYTCESS